MGLRKINRLRQELAWKSRAHGEDEARVDAVRRPMVTGRTFKPLSSCRQATSTRCSYS